MTARTTDDRGLTLVEMLIAMAVFGIVMAAGMTFLRDQGRSYARGSTGVTVLENVRFASDLLEREIRTAGSNVPDGQPFLVVADSAAIAFNADLTTNVPDDPFAVYHDPDAPDEAVSALTRSMRLTLPGTSFAYPDTNYRSGPGINSAAETVTFVFRPDSSTARTDDVVLFRAVNGHEPELLARNLLRTPGAPFFAYVEEVEVAGQPRVADVPASALPLTHSVPVHGSPADVGSAAAIDRIRAVRVSFTTTDGSTGAGEHRRAIVQTVRLANAGLSISNACGDAPILGTDPTASVATLPGGRKGIEIEWDPAVDEDGGEEDVVRYVVWRRTDSGEWGDPLTSLAAGRPRYSHQDGKAEPGVDYWYRLAAQDCSARQSETSTVGPIRYEADTTCGTGTGNSGQGSGNTGSGSGNSGSGSGSGSGCGNSDTGGGGS